MLSYLKIYLCMCYIYVISKHHIYIYIPFKNWCRHITVRWVRKYIHMCTMISVADIVWIYNTIRRTKKNSIYSEVLSAILPTYLYRFMMMVWTCFHTWRYVCVCAIFMCFQNAIYIPFKNWCRHITVRWVRKYIHMCTMISVADIVWIYNTIRRTKKTGYIQRF